MHRRTSTFSYAALMFLTSGTLAVAQPGFGPPGGFRGPGEFGGPPGDMMRMLPVMAALDKDGDGEISKEEITNATAALKGLDKNEDGKLTLEELRPDFRRGPEGRGPEGRGPEVRSPEGRSPEGRGPEGRSPEGRSPEGRSPEGRSPEGRSPEGRGPEGRSPEGRGERDAAERGPGFGPRDPEQFIKRAFEFDADEDGKLSREELTKMLDSMGRGRDEGTRPSRPERE